MKIYLVFYVVYEYDNFSKKVLEITNNDFGFTEEFNAIKRVEELIKNTDFEKVFYKEIEIK